MEQGSLRNGQRKSAQAPEGVKVPEESQRRNLVPPYRHTEAQRSRIRMKGYKYRLVTSEHYETREDLMHAMFKYPERAQSGLHIQVLVPLCVKQNFQ